MVYSTLSGNTETLGSLLSSVSVLTSLQQMKSYSTLQSKKNPAMLQALHPGKPEFTMTKCIFSGCVLRLLFQPV